MASDPSFVRVFLLSWNSHGDGTWQSCHSRLRCLNRTDSPDSVVDPADTETRLLARRRASTEDEGECAVGDNKGIWRAGPWMEPIWLRGPRLHSLHIIHIRRAPVTGGVTAEGKQQHFLVAKNGQPRTSHKRVTSLNCSRYGWRQLENARHIARSGREFQNGCLTAAGQHSAHGGPVFPLPRTSEPITFRGRQGPHHRASRIKRPNRSLPHQHVE
mmetsp:Transcript_52524/g.139869  ORF Transcript_52524/g.139869 Transcript_52524/m.139869 type:complete len:215 (-) Transcript_52524:395-1039(-)